MESNNMNWHKEVTKPNGDEYDTIYCTKTALEFLRTSKHKALTVSRMKHENIRIAIIENKASLKVLKDVNGKLCGYCFKYTCNVCPITEKCGTECCLLEECEAMRNAQSIEEFADAHKKWCKKIGVWVKSWE